MMTKREVHTARSVHRIDLSLPVVQTDSYEIFYAVPPSQTLRTLSSRHKPFSDINKKNVNQTTRIRTPARLKHLIGPVVVDSVVDVAPLTAESISTTNDTSSNQLSNSGYSNRMLKSIPTMNKRNKQKNLKDDSDRSPSSADDRLIYESFGSFDEYNINKIKNNNMWQNVHHPQLTSTKTLHIRRTPKHVVTTNDMHIKVSNTTSFDNLSQESTASANDQLYKKIEQLTKAYFPAIQKIRHNRPFPELISNRMNVYREQGKNFMPILSRTRFVR